MPPSNNPGNILAGQGYAGQTGDTYTGKTSGLTYTKFDSPEMGLRAVFQEVRGKLEEFDGDVELALLKYLGGDKGTKEERYARAATDNEDPVGYIQRGIEAYKKEGEKGLVKQIIINENRPEHRDYYLDNLEAIDTAEKLSIMDLPSGTTFENALKVYQQGEYSRKEGGMISRNPYPYNPRPI
jgi:hypothetical protein